MKKLLFLFAIAILFSCKRNPSTEKVAKNKIKEFEKLIEKDELTPQQRKTLIDLRNYFAHSPKYLSNELMVKLQELSLKELTKKKKEE